MGYGVTTLRDRYGEEHAQKIKDHDWIKDATDMGELILTKDPTIRYNALEQEAMRAGKGRGFCMPNANMNIVEIRRRFEKHINRIIQRGRQSGPYMYGVYRDGLGLLWPLERTDLSRR